MYQTTTLLASDAVDTLDLENLALDHGLSGIPAAIDALNGVIGDPDIVAPALSNAINRLLQAFEADTCSPEAYAALFGIRADMASTMFDSALNAAFGDDVRDVDCLSESGAVLLIGLLSAADAHEQAAALIAETRKLANSSALAKAAWMARCRWAGCDAAITAHLSAPSAPFETLDDAQRAIGTSPLTIDGHRARIRFGLDAHDIQKACEAIAVALALPMADSEKMVIASDLAIVVAAMAVRGELGMLESDRLRWAVAAAPGVTQAAAVAIERGFSEGTLPFLDDGEAMQAAASLRRLVRAERGVTTPAVTGFPMRNGKPHVDIVWLEITNHCNQKCTFCPDMFREDARTWLPLAQVKQLIDQLADTISVGSMQLNAYGEPLLHPNIAEIIAYIRKRKLPFPTFFTSHGMTLVDKKLQQLSHNYPSGIAISLHNDSQASYEATRSYKVGDYDTLVSRVTALLRQMAFERAPSHLRLYQMVSNLYADQRVDPVTRGAFPDTPARMLAHVRQWEAIAAEIAAAAPADTRTQAYRNSDAAIQRAFLEASHGDGHHLPVLTWLDQGGTTQTAFISARPVGTYANLVLEYDPRWQVERKMVNAATCHFTKKPSLAIFATGKLGVCCLDLNSTATFGSLSDFDDLHHALTSPQALQMLAQLSNGVAVGRGCQICLGGTERLCGNSTGNGPVRPAGHFPRASRRGDRGATAGNVSGAAARESEGRSKLTKRSATSSFPRRYRP